MDLFDCQEYQLNDIDDDFLNLMDDSGDTREDIKLPEGELGEEIKVPLGSLKSLSYTNNICMTLENANLINYERF